jgi:hypothetical protein
MTKGVLWELSTAIKLVQPERLLLLVPRTGQYEAFCRTYASFFPVGLPTTGAQGQDLIEEIGSLAGILYFQPDWTPHLLRLKPCYPYSLGNSLKLALKITVLPVFDQLGLSYRPLAIPRTVRIEKIFSIFFMTLVSGFLIIGILFDLVDFLYPTISSLVSILRVLTMIDVLLR